MSLRRFHGTRLLQRGQGIDDNLLRDDGTILGEADSAEPGTDVFLRVPKLLLYELDVRPSPIFWRIECNYIR